MTCHNASPKNDYKGPGLPNPHPFPGAAKIKCSTCHGGNPKGEDQGQSHVPPPPEIGDDDNLLVDRHAYFNRLTLTGIDKFPDYEVNGQMYTALDYLQFINPGDLRVVQDGRSCGECHSPHVDDVGSGLLATQAGMLSGALYAVGQDNHVNAQQGLYQDTAAGVGFRAVVDPNYIPDSTNTGAVEQLLEYPVFSRKGVLGPDDIQDNDLYLSASLANHVDVDGQVVSNSPLANLYHEQVAFTCGDCHLGSAGANNRTGDYRSSGCTACHMPYSLGGRYLGSDPNVNKTEPLDPDDIDEPERPHVREHRIVSVARTLSNGVQQQGIDDYSCAGCHQGSNRTVMQYWGIRLDQNEDVRRGVQYPANPVSYVDTRDDERLFDPVLGNKEFNGRDSRQYLLFEDYDGDGRDDTPADVHYEAGMGCIDCHGSYDLHGGDVKVPGAEIYSRMEHGTAISCDSCHGTSEAYAQTKNGKTYGGQSAQLALDSGGRVLKHVERRADGNYWLTSRLTGEEHYIPQAMDTVVDNGVLHPEEPNTPIYTPMASFAMGRADGDPATGLGPLQQGLPNAGFRHADSMDCASCHSAWTNTCAGCHLEGEYNKNNNFSNITGEEIVFREKNADFVYQSPLPFQLGIDPDGKITQTSPNTKMFFTYFDRFGTESQAFAFSDRNAKGANPLEAAFPSMSHNAMMAHSIRGRVDDQNEGPRYCVACHLTDDGLADFGEANYDAFVAAMETGDFGSLDYDMLQEHIGQNPGNTLNSPVWVHMASGLGSGLFLFDENGAPVNPLDMDSNRAGTDNNQAPGSIPFDPNSVVYDLDRIVDGNGEAQGSNNHALIDPAVGSALRQGADNPSMAGPLGGPILQRLTNRQTGIVLDSWVDADGKAQGGAVGVADGP